MITLLFKITFKMINKEIHLQNLQPLLMLCVMKLPTFYLQWEIFQSALTSLSVTIEWSIPALLIT